MSSAEERALLQRAQGGDREALGLLWDDLTPKLFGYLINVTRDKALAEDLLQNTWLRAVQALPKFQQRNVSLSAWLFAIARNELRQHWRKSGREVAFDEALHDQTTENSEEQDKIEVERILKLLSEDDREIIRLRYIADLPVSEIAKVLNINYVAVRVRLHRAIKRCQTFTTN